MNANQIKFALTTIHIMEKSSENPDGMSRVNAAKHVLARSYLSHDETVILLRALHISPEEWSKAVAGPEALTSGNQ